MRESSLDIYLVLSASIPKDIYFVADKLYEAFLRHKDFHVANSKPELIHFRSVLTREKNPSGGYPLIGEYFHSTFENRLRLHVVDESYAIPRRGINFSIEREALSAIQTNKLGFYGLVETIARNFGVSTPHAVGASFELVFGFGIGQIANKQESRKKELQEAISQLRKGNGVFHRNVVETMAESELAELAVLNQERNQIIIGYKTTDKHSEIKQKNQNPVYRILSFGVKAHEDFKGINLELKTNSKELRRLVDSIATQLNSAKTPGSNLASVFDRSVAALVSLIRSSWVGGLVFSFFWFYGFPFEDVSPFCPTSIAALSSLFVVLLFAFLKQLINHAAAWKLRLALKDMEICFPKEKMENMPLEKITKAETAILCRIAGTWTLTTGDKEKKKALRYASSLLPFFDSRNIPAKTKLFGSFLEVIWLLAFVCLLFLSCPHYAKLFTEFVKG